MATLTPAAAATTAAAVERFSEPAPSPPVPTTSSSGVTPIGGRTARARSAAAAPDSSAGASPFMRSAISSAAICGGGHSCPTIVPIAAAISSCDRLSRWATFSRTWVNIEISFGARKQKARRTLVGRAIEPGVVRMLFRHGFCRAGPYGRATTTSRPQQRPPERR
ncbi:MAG: hypothetical protein U1F37_09710 [Alphaproteobacteria bacterium]